MPLVGLPISYSQPVPDILACTELLFQTKVNTGVEVALKVPDLGVVRIPFWVCGIIRPRTIKGTKRVPLFWQPAQVRK